MHEIHTRTHINNSYRCLKISENRCLKHLGVCNSTKLGLISITGLFFLNNEASVSYIIPKYHTKKLHDWHAFAICQAGSKILKSYQDVDHLNKKQITCPSLKLVKILSILSSRFLTSSTFSGFESHDPMVHEL